MLKVEGDCNEMCIRDRVITFNHTAYSKAIFAKGALEAAKFLAGKEPGLYDMSDVVQL